MPMPTDKPTTCQNSIDTKILNAILFVYPFDVFTVICLDKVLGAFSPFRMIIFPLCLYYILRYRSSGRTAQNKFIPIVVLFFFFCILGIISTSSSAMSSMFSFLGSIAQFVCAYRLFSRNEFKRSTLIIITLWAIIQVPSFLDCLVNENISMALRFSGYFFDPNYYCAYCIPAFFAAFSLFKNEESKKYKYYSIFIMSFSLVSVFLTFSRGGLLSLVFLGATYLFIYHRKLLLLLVVISIPISSYLMIKAKYLTWYDGADNIFDGFLYRTFTLSGDMNELTAGRVDYFHVFLDNIDSYFLVGMDVNSYFEKYNEGHFIHNGLAELCIQSGIAVGLLFLVILALAIYKILKRIVSNRVIPIGFLLFFSSLLCLTFLSYSTKYSWLCFGMVFALVNKNEFIKNKYDL